MKKLFFILSFFVLLTLAAAPAFSQCSVCAKTSLQMGEKPAKGLNTAILYLMFAPFLIVGIIGYRWWKTNKKIEEEEM
jgi:hypothetical protein